MVLQHTDQLPVSNGTAIGGPYLHQNVVSFCNNTVVHGERLLTALSSQDISDDAAILSPILSVPETQRPSVFRTDSTTRTTRWQRRHVVLVCSNPDTPISRNNSTLNLSLPSLGLESSPTLSTSGGQPEEDEHASIDTPTTPTVTYPLAEAEECTSHETPELTEIGLPHILNIDLVGITPTSTLVSSSSFTYRASSGSRETMSKGYLGISGMQTGAH